MRHHDPAIGLVGDEAALLRAMLRCLARIGGRHDRSARCKAHPQIDLEYRHLFLCGLAHQIARTVLLGCHRAAALQHMPAQPQPASGTS
jgi:hypothetical protein